VDGFVFVLRAEVAVEEDLVDEVKVLDVVAAVEDEVAEDDVVEDVWREGDEVDEPVERADFPEVELAVVEPVVLVETDDSFSFSLSFIC
jgi:hypothetical protein